MSEDAFRLTDRSASLLAEELLPTPQTTVAGRRLGDNHGRLSSFLCGKLNLISDFCFEFSEDEFRCLVYEEYRRLRLLKEDSSDKRFNNIFCNIIK